MIQRTVLPNGVVVLTEQLPNARSAAVDLWIGQGSRSETRDNNGIAHFFEHAVFKGNRHRDALEIVSAIERKGGVINASTTREKTHFYCRTVGEEWSTALSVLTELVSTPLFTPSEIRLEREVILEEIRWTLDLPDDLADDLCSRALWGDEGLGLPIAGTISSVRRLNSEKLKQYHQQLMHCTPIVVTAAGTMEHSAVVEQVRRELTAKKTTKKLKIGWQKPLSKMLVRHRDLQQASVVLATALPLRQEWEGIALSVIHLLLGDGMSSKLFQRVREESGLVYSIATAPSRVSGGAAFSLMFGAEPGRAKEALREIAAVLFEVKREGLSEGDVEMAKEMLCGGMLMAGEQTAACSAALAHWEFLGRTPETVEQRVHKVMELNPEQVNLVLKQLLQSNRWAGGAVVPDGQRLDLSKGLQF